MRSELTTDQIAFYREHGFVVLERFFDADETARWSRVTDEAVEQRLQTKMPAGSHALHNQGNPDDFYAQVFTQCLRLADTHAEMRELMYDRRLARIGARLAGVDGLRVWHDQALYKPPFGNPTAWHLDNPYWSFTSRDALSVWIALDDATLGNGCLWYIPGSHHSARYDNAGIGREQSALFGVYPEWRDIAPVPAPAPAGSIVWHNGLTAHGAGANMTNRPRRAMTCAFMPDGSTFNGQQNILSAAQMATLTVGDRLDDEQQNPLVWHTSWES